MSEPINPDKYYIIQSTIEVDGRKGKGQIMKWYDEEEKCYKEKILAFEAESGDSK